MLFTQEYTLIPSLNEEQRSFLATLIFILETNLIIASVISILGFLTGGLLSIMVLFFNGLKIGEILNVSNGDIEIVVSYLIGHGIFEIQSITQLFASIVLLLDKPLLTYI